MKEKVIHHNKERNKKQVTVTSYLKCDDDDRLLEGRTVKRYVPEYPSREENLVREAGIMALANRTGLPAVRLISSAPDQGVMETEFIPGANLAQRLAHPFITQDEIRLLVTGAINCLFAFHKKGIILIDTHPSNFIVRVPDEACIFCDFGLAFAPRTHPFKVPPPTRNDSSYFSPQQNLAIGTDIRAFAADRSITEFDSNRLEAIGDVYVLANRLLAHSCSEKADDDLLKTLVKMKNGEFRSVGEILRYLDETAPAHLKGTPDAVPLEELKEFLEREPVSHLSGLGTVGLRSVAAASVAVIFLAAVLAKVQGGRSGLPTEAKTPATVASTPRQNPEAAENAPLASFQGAAPRTRLPQPLVAQASELARTSSPAKYRETVAVLASQPYNPDAKALLSRELDRACKNVASNRLSRNRKGIAALFALQAFPSEVSGSAKDAIEHFYDRASSSAERVDIQRLQLLAQEHHAGAQWSLGKIYEQGAAVPRDLARAYRYYSCAKAKKPAAGKALERLERQEIVRLFHSTKLNTMKEGFRLLQAIAEVPANKEAQYTLAQIYRDGMPGVAKNRQLARRFLLIAARNGNEEAKRELERW